MALCAHCQVEHVRGRCPAASMRFLLLFAVVIATVVAIVLAAHYLTPRRIPEPARGTGSTPK